MNTSNNNIDNAWNPFNPTKRDIVRTQELASKNAVLAVILTCLFVSAGLIYLNRGVNILKIFGYFVAACFMVGVVAESEESAGDLGSLLGIAFNGVVTAEQVVAVNKARQRSL